MISKRSYGYLDYEGELTETTSIRPSVCFRLGEVLKEDTEIEMLSDALKEASVPDYERVADICLEKSEKAGMKGGLRLSYVVAYMFTFGTEENYTDNPFWKINHFLIGDDFSSFGSVRGLIWGLFCGLRTLPFKQYDVLYRGLKHCVEWKEGEFLIFSCFTTVTRNKRTAESLLGVSENGEPEGTLIRIEGKWGYDLSGLGIVDDEHDIIMEASTFVTAECVKTGNVVNINIEPIFSEDTVLEREIPQLSEERMNGMRSENEKNYKKAMWKKNIRDYEECFKILRRLYYEGYREGEIEYAIMNIFGNHSLKNIKLGFHLLNEYEKYEDGRVFYKLGVCYQMGYGSEKDMNKSYNYFIKSLLCGYPPAIHKICYSGEVSGDVCEEDQLRYSDVKKRASEGDGLCLGIYGCCLIHGVFGEKDLEEGFKQAKQSYERGNSFGQNIIGDCYYHGWGVDKNMKKAFECYKLSSEQGDCDADLKLGLYYLNEKGSKKKSYSFAHFLHSAKQEHPVSQYELGLEYLRKEDPESQSEGIFYLKLSAEQGYEKAIRELENMKPVS